jgi:hypothetical protein
MNKKINYQVEYILSSAGFIPEYKTLLVRAVDYKDAIKQAEEHAFKNYPKMQFVRVKKIIEL